MFEILQIVTLLLVAIAMALSFAHALELPGKLRLSREQYLAVQPIYYPGFTIGGASEPIGIIALLLLCFFTPTDTPQFWLTICAFAALALAHATYWMFTHPVNNFWLKDFQLKGLGAGFFGVGNSDRKQQAGMPEWTELRDRWEFSHVARALFSMLSLVLLTTALVI